MPTGKRIALLKPISNRTLVGYELPNKRLANLLHSWTDYLLAPVDGSSLAVFRMLFGALMFIEVCRYFAHNWIYTHYIQPQFFFGFIPHIRPWAGDGMYWHFTLMGCLSLLIAFGLYYRIAAGLFCLAITYVFLLDKALYLNHMYLICLVSFLMFLSPAHHAMSIDSLRQPDKFSGTVPRWCVLLLRMQISLVYFFGGIAKLNPDWLSGHPQSSWMEERSYLPLIGPYLSQKWFVMLITFGGLFINLSAGFLLWFRKTFWIAALVTILFNLMNCYLF